MATGLLLHLDGPAGSTTFVDATGRHTITANGAAQVDTTSVFGNGSAIFDGSTSNLSTAGNFNDFNFGTGDFTIDFRIRPSAAASFVLSFGTLAAGNFPVIQQLGTNIHYRFNALDQIAGSITVPNDGSTWTHVAVTRSGTNTRLFINGIQDGSTYVGADNLINDDANNCPRLGSDNTGGTSNYRGWIDELRIVKGIALWTSNFTPPTGPYSTDIFEPRDPIYSNPRGYEYHIQFRGWAWSYNLNLIGQDVLPAGEIRAELPAPRDYPILLRQWFGEIPPVTVTAPFFQEDWPLPRGTEYPISLRSLTGRLAAFLLPPFSQEDWPLPRGPVYPVDIRTITESYNFNLVGQDFVPGKTITDRPALPAALLQTWITSVNLALTTVSVAPPFSQDYWPLTPSALRGTDLGTWISQTKLLLAVPFNQSDWPLPKPLAPAAKSYTASYNLNLIGQDAFPTGERLYDLPTPRDYSNQLRQWFGAIPPVVTVVTAPFSQSDWPVTREYREGRTWLWSYNLNLIGQDQLPSGEATTDLPPRQPQQPTPILVASYNKNLIGQDQLPTGVESTALPPQPALSAIQLRNWINTTSLALLAGPQIKPFFQTDWPINIGPRQPTPVFTASYNKNLVGQDQLPTGESITWLPQQPLFANQLRTWIQTVNLALQSKVFQLPFNQYDWPLPRAPYRPLSEYSKAFKLPLIGLDVLPFNQFNWPTPAQKIRPLDLLTWINQVSQVLIAPHRQKDWPTPIGYQQPASSYTFSYNLNLIGKDALPNRQQYWPLTPDVRRYIDFAASTNPNLFAQPVVVRYTFREPFYTPPRGHIYPALMRSITAGLNLALKVPPAPLPHNQTSWPLPGQPAPLWQRYSYEFQGNVIYWGFVNPIPPPPDPTPPENVRLIYNAGNEWQMLDRIREPGPVGWR